MVLFIDNFTAFHNMYIMPFIWYQFFGETQ